MESGSSGGSRWTPTKDQIDLLENLYMQGMRTPSADQIQHITSKLKAFGDIEGKNVFYWFQNHKARQRQKQKQQLFNRRFLIPPPPHFPTNYLNVYMPPPGCYRKRALPQGTINNILYTKPYCNAPNQEPMLYQQNLSMQNNVNGKGDFNRNQETLDLFPLHPTGNLQPKRASISIPDTNYLNTTGNFGHDQPFIDFLCMDSQYARARAAEDTVKF